MPDEALGNGKVFVMGSGFVDYTLEATESAFKHGGSDKISLKMELQKALNIKDSEKEDQGDNTYKVRINSGKGYLVYKLDGTKATLFHYHWNYNLDGPLKNL